MKLMIDRLIFSLFGGIIGGATYAFVIRRYVTEPGKPFQTIDLLWVFLAVVAGALLFYVVYPEIVAFFKLMGRLFQKIFKRMVLTDMIILFFALFLTVVIYIFIEPILRALLPVERFNIVSMVLTPALFVFIWGLGFAKRDSIIEGTRILFGSSIQQAKTDTYVLDSSSLIDGRVAELLLTTTLNGKFVVPSFVLFDLQRISDSPDQILSHRGKRGMITLEKIQEQMGKKLEVVTTQNRGRQIELLQKFAKEGAIIVSCDMEVTNEIRRNGGIVCNLNEAASALKTMIVPGEEAVIHVIKEGKESGQGVGFLDDGTMVVIEDGKKAMGQTVRIICTSLLQNPQGRIVFGKIVQK